MRYAQLWGHWLPALVVACAVSTTYADMELLVVDQGGDRVLKYSPTGQYIGVFATFPTANTPYGVDQSPDGNTIYVSEFSGGVYRFDKQGTPLDVGPLFSIGNFTSPVDRIYGISVSSAGNLHIGTQVAANTIGQVHRFTPAGTPLAGNGETGSRFTDNVSARVRFSTFDPEGNLWVSQTDLGAPTGNQVYKFNGTTGDLLATFDLDASTTANPEGWDLSFGPSFNPGGTQDLYVATLGGGVNRISIYEGATGASLGSIALSAGFAPSGVEVNRNNWGEMIITSMNNAGSRRFIINGDGTYTDAGAFLVGGPGGVVPSNLQSLRFVPEPSAMGMAVVGFVTLMHRCRRRR